MLNNLTARGKIILSLIIFLVIVVLFAAGYFAWQKHADTAAKLQQAIVLTEKQAQDKNVLQNKLDMSNQNAEMLANYIKQAQAGQVQPVTHFTIQAPTVQTAAEQVAERINAKDSTLPPQALTKTDNTIVVPNEKKTADANYDIGIFKVNNYRNWEWSAGYGKHHGDSYIPVGLQRNYSKNKAIEAEMHIDPGNFKDITGWEVKQVWKTDKLFFIF